MAASRPAAHGRTTSEQSVSSSNSATKMILEHILTYPGTYELPLRTMYALNSAPRGAPRPTSPGKPLPQPAEKPGQAARQLTSSLMAELSQLPNQPNSLPPSFITTFVRKCFAPELRLVDFAQALTALDYLKDLESRRCREAKAALERLQITLDNCHTAEKTLQNQYPAALEWYKSLEDKVYKTEAYYAQLYISLRRWILINELSLTPFGKHNCVAMLNTIYPPVASPQVTPHLSAKSIKDQRDGFFKYIQAVEKNGPSILANLMNQGRRPGEETGWSAACEVLDKYLQIANSMIDECLQITSLEEAAKLNSARNGRKADSGISFIDSRKSSTSSEKSTHVPDRPLSRGQYKSTTTLEKIAREIRHIRRNKTDVSEMITQQDDEHATATEAKPVRKMKSLGALGLRRTASRAESVDPHSPTKMPSSYDAEKLRRGRLAYARTTPQEVFMMAAAG